MAPPKGWTHPLLRDLTGQRFGRLVVEAPAAFRSGCRWWRCRCDCGTVKEIRGPVLNRGEAKSCGCRKRDIGRERTAPGGVMDGRRHGGWRSPEYRIWRGMKIRCCNPRSKDFPRYGGRGIRVCQRWLDSFAAFLADVGPRPAPHLTLDRIDNDGHYEPGNVRWATRSEQQQNKRPFKRRR
jgi:hypothetical protein